MRGLSKYAAMGAALSRREEEQSRADVLKEIGGMLRDAREAYQVSVSEAASVTRVAAEHLSALESGDWSKMPGDVYARGYLRRYAEYLGFQPAEMLAKLSPAAPKIDIIKTPVITRHRQPIISPPAIAALAIVALALVFGAVVTLLPASKTEPQVQPPPARLALSLDAPPPALMQPAHCLGVLSGSSMWGCYLPLRLREQPSLSDSVLYGAP